MLISFRQTIMAAAAVAALASCSHSPAGWSVEGTIEGLDNPGKIAVEAFNNRNWYVLDSVEVSADGKFSYEAAEPAAYPEIMRIALPSSDYIYFPVDSIDAIKITADATGKADLSGTRAAEQLSAAVGLIDRSLAENGIDSTLRNMTLKRDLIDLIVADSSTIVAYYIINREIDGRPLFNPVDTFDNRVYGAAANVYRQHRPDDQRGKTILEMYTYGRKMLGKIKPVERVYQASESGLIDISLYDNRGQLRKLSDITGNDKVTLLSFTAYDEEFSPAYNLLLNNLYTRYHDKGLEIYQVAFDEDEAAWRVAAQNIPWTAVWNSPSDGMTVLRSYMVDALPTTFIIDRNGDIGSREANPDKLASAVEKYF